MTVAVERSSPAASKKGRELKWTWRKPKDKPKRNLSAYNMFISDIRPEIMAERLRHDDTNHSICSVGDPPTFLQIASERWKNVNAKIKESYKRRAKEEKERYKVELVQWQKDQLLRQQASEALAVAVARKVDESNNKDTRCAGPESHQVIASINSWDAYLNDESPDWSAPEVDRTSLLPPSSAVSMQDCFLNRIFHPIDSASPLMNAPKMTDPPVNQYCPAMTASPYDDLSAHPGLMRLVNQVPHRGGTVSPSTEGVLSETVRRPMFRDEGCTPSLRRDRDRTLNMDLWFVNYQSAGFDLSIQRANMANETSTSIFASDPLWFDIKDDPSFIEDFELDDAEALLTTFDETRAFKRGSLMSSVGQEPAMIYLQ